METKNEVCYEEVKTILEKELVSTNTIKVDFGGTILRVQKAYGKTDLFVVAKGKKHYGYYLYDYLHRNNFSYVNVIKAKKNTPIEVKWLTQMKKIEHKLEVSGLWQDTVLKDIKSSIAIGYSNLKLAQEIYNKSHEGLDYRAGLEENAKLVKLIDEKLMKDDVVNTNLLWNYTSIPKVKKMRFSRYDNDTYLKDISDCMKNKVACHKSSRLGYDVSFEYNPDTNRAWYSEEYRGCGNGHYYIALDATHALFSEDD